MQSTVFSGAGNDAALLQAPVHQCQKYWSWCQCDSSWPSPNSVKSLRCQPLHVNKETAWFFGPYYNLMSLKLSLFPVLQWPLYHLPWWILDFQTGNKTALLCFDYFFGILSSFLAEQHFLSHDSWYQSLIFSTLMTLDSCHCSSLKLYQHDQQWTCTSEHMVQRKNPCSLGMFVLVVAITCVLAQHHQ